MVRIRMIEDERLYGDAAQQDSLELSLGVAVLLSSTDEGLDQKASGVCVARIWQGRTGPPSIRLDWHSVSLQLDTRPGHCLVVDLADGVVVIYNTIDSDCSVIRFSAECFRDDAFEIFINIASEHCTFVSREQAAQNEILLALGNSPEFLHNQAETASAPNSTSGLSSRIDSGADLLVSGIERYSSMICGSLTFGSEMLQRHIEPAAHPMPIHPQIRNGFRLAGSAANVFASGIASMGETISSSFNNSNTRAPQQAAAVQLVRSSIRGAARVALASTDASLSILQSALGAATGVLARKYGHGLGEILEDGTRVFYSMRLASRALRRICLQLLIDGFSDELNPYIIE